MLHMVLMRHGPDTCAAGHPDVGEMARAGTEQMDATASKLGITIQGAWADPPAHTFFTLADAPNAHVLNQLMIETRLFLWNTIEIHPIVTMAEAVSLAATA